ncbi:Cyclin-dependent kinase inhibitor 6 [Cardamine amara subsp. amara]|uniref:Cyclin-dependent kinase inhibitor n=1 Tax=Cardamine amara subsp. amara TaxID=228776 RepID=A0ABD1A7Q6_CARAN
MSEKIPNPSPNCKREFEEASSISVSLPLKKTKLDDDDDSSDSHDVVVFANPSSSSSSVSSSTPSGSDECSVTSAGQENELSSSISSGCFSSESKEIAKNSSTFVSDLEAHQISENETSTIINSNFRKETSPVSEALGETTTEMKSSSSASKKTPTPAEIDNFLSELEEKNDEKQKKFIEKYNFDIVNDKPLEGRYKWDRFKP